MGYKRIFLGISSRDHRVISIQARFFLTFIVLVFAFVDGLGKTMAEVPESAIPRAGSRLAKDLQNALNTAKCFPPGTPSFARRDGKFGSPKTNTRSRKAINNWLATTGISGSSFTSPLQLRDSVRSSAAICSTQTKGTCRKDSIGAQYLSRLKGIDDVQRLSISLQTAISNFDKGETGKQSAVFPPGKGDSVKISPDNQKNIEEYGVVSVTPKTTKAALKAALHNFDNLILSYALKTPACQNCATINDWLYLRNIASANAGILIAKSSTTDAFKAFSVNKITKGQMDPIRENVYVFRSITTKLNQTLANGGESKNIAALIAERNSHLFTMLDHFQKTAVASGGTQMVVLARQSKCIGFTGGAIYQ